MHVQILSTGSSGNAVVVNQNILVDAGITTKLFKTFSGVSERLDGFIVTHKHGDHMNLPLIKYLLTKCEIKGYLAPDVVDILRSDTKLNVDELLTTGQIHVIEPNISFYISDVKVTPQPQKHGKIINFSLILEKNERRVLYATDLDTLEPSDMGVGLMDSGMFDTILFEGNYDEVWLREYIQYIVSLSNTEALPETLTDTELQNWVYANYKTLPKQDAQNAFRAVQNMRHLSKQQARTFVTQHLKTGGTYYEIHRSSAFYEKPDDWLGV